MWRQKRFRCVRCILSVFQQTLKIIIEAQWTVCEFVLISCKKKENNGILCAEDFTSSFCCCIKRYPLKYVSANIESKFKILLSWQPWCKNTVSSPLFVSSQSLLVCGEYLKTVKEKCLNKSFKLVWYLKEVLYKWPNKRQGDSDVKTFKQNVLVDK